MPTWYGMFLPSGETTESVDAMQYAWTGHWPEFRSPQLKGLWLDGKTARENVRLSAGQNCTAKVLAESPVSAALVYRWEILEESAAQSVGGDRESQPERLAGLVSEGAGAEANIKAPAKPGAYRLFVYASDGRGKAAYANIPFFVDGKTAALAAHE